MAGSAPLRVAVLGSAGRMGSTVCSAIAGDPALELVGAVDPQAVGLTAPGGVVTVADIATVAAAGAQVAVDFTVAASALANAAECAASGIHMVVGTTGMGAPGISELERLFSSGRANCLVAANFAIGAVLLMRFAELAAPYMDSVEIIELHHAAKLDAPSGTALTTAERIAAARAAAGAPPLPADATTKMVLEGARGGQAAGGVRIHSVRLAGLVAHQEVLMGTTGQTLTIRHDSLDRQSFMPGVLLAVKEVPARPGLTVGIESLLGI